FILQHVTTHLIGQAIDEHGNPLVNFGMQAFPENSGGFNATTANTDANGNFDVGVFGGVWHLQAKGGDALAFGYVFPDYTFNVADGQDITGIRYLLRQSTAGIIGSIHDMSGNPVGD